MLKGTKRTPEQKRATAQTKKNNVVAGKTKHKKK